MTKYFATRSAIKSPNSDYDAAMAHQQLGPFSDKETARTALAVFLTDALISSAAARPGSIQADFLSQYNGLVMAMATNPGDVFEADGIRWTIRSV